MSDLNSGQEQFCREYIKDFNGTRAAMAAGYSEKTAHAQASRLLKNVKIKTRMAELKAEVQDRLNIQIDDVVTGLYRIASEDEEPASARVAAWAHLGKHLGMFTEKVEHSGELEIREIKRKIIYQK